ncbi:MAG TPA: AAA family ATPase [Terriglobales bacterium]|jgi:general secretion pathway protein A|nr:AAA family ATPase [Terriglobales bacterium]
MYKSFYNLQRAPFEITPDPSFLFPTTRHNEALASLYYGVTAHRGFVVLTGEVGTGKTLILRSLLGLLQRRDVAFALVFNPTLSPVEFMRYIALDFGLQVTGKAKDELIHVLNAFLLQRHQKGLTTILVVDEAHHLSSEVLEEIRLLTNLETSQQKLLQIVLAGQPELDQKLDSHELRQLKQRIALRCHLDPLNAIETREYMRRRLQIAGANGAVQIFSGPAIEAVYTHSRGIPRIINTICENALLAGYAKHAPTITSEIIDGVAQDLRVGVVVADVKNSAAGRRSKEEEQQNELLQAVKTLLEVRDRMHQTETKGRLQ